MGITGDEFFLKAAQPLRERGFSQPGWGNVTGLAMYSWITCIDVTGSYASNEIAINWNASLVSLLGWIDAEMKSSTN